ncbi:hypothetical protein ACVWWN_000678 [Mycobacterium sp. URHB0021]|jgi:hypothetical protein
MGEAAGGVQVKRFSDNLNSTEKRAIKRSFSRVLETSKKEGWEITEWHLVMPLDLTTHNLSWMDTYVADAGFRGSRPAPRRATPAARTRA